MNSELFNVHGKTVIITGSSGAIGSACVNLFKKDFNVVGVDLKSTEGIYSIEADISSVKDIDLLQVLDISQVGKAYAGKYLVTGIKIEGIIHEQDTVEGLAEDVVDVILLMLCC